MPADGSTQIVYKYGSIQQGRDSIARFVSFMDGELNDVESGGRRLLGTWSSDASGAFDACVRRWNDNARELAALLFRLGDAMDDGVIDMQAADKQATALFPY